MTNIITGFVASVEVTQNLLENRALGRKEMLKVLNNRLINKEVGIFETFLQKLLKVTLKSEEKLIVADR